jgi:RNA polymerase sigma-70 factor (ECF subfamily)
VVQRLGEPEACGLLALMSLHEARRASRVDAAGELVLLEHQDRAAWDRGRIAEAQALIEGALGMRRIGPYLLQAAIAAVHVEAESAAAMDWTQIVGLYDTLRRIDPSPVVALNRAAAIGMQRRPAAGLRAIDELLEGGALQVYPLAHAARADMLRRLGHVAAARAAYERALELTRQPAGQRFLAARLASLAGEAGD